MTTLFRFRSTPTLALAALFALLGATTLGTACSSSSGGGGNKGGSGGNGGTEAGAGSGGTSGSGGADASAGAGGIDGGAGWRARPMVAFSRLIWRSVIFGRSAKSTSSSWLPNTSYGLPVSGWMDGGMTVILPAARKSMLPSPAAPLMTVDLSDFGAREDRHTLFAALARKHGRPRGVFKLQTWRTELHQPVVIHVRRGKDFAFAERNAGADRDCCSDVRRPVRAAAPHWGCRSGCPSNLCRRGLCRSME